MSESRVRHYYSLEHYRAFSNFFFVSAKIKWQHLLLCILIILLTQYISQVLLIVWLAINFLYMWKKVFITFGNYRNSVPKNFSTCMQLFMVPKAIRMVKILSLLWFHYSWDTHIEQLDKKTKYSYFSKFSNLCKLKTDIFFGVGTY